ncbi:unnamed protein product [Victoria cruziana]
MRSLKYLNLAHNQLQVPLDDMFGSLQNLGTMDLSYNNFTGSLPSTFSSLTSLNTLYLQYNQFSGSIDVLTHLPLKNLNVAHNHFTGWIPAQLKNINSIQTDGNSWNTGPAPPPPPYTPSPGRSNNKSGGNDNQNVGGKKSGVSGGGVAGILITILVIGGVLAFFILRKRRRSTRSSDEEKLNQGQPFSLLGSNEVKELKSVQSSASTTLVPLQPTSLDIVKPLAAEHHKTSNGDEFLKKKPTVKRANIPPINASVYSVADLQMATCSFSIDNLVGEGSIGRVYKAQFADGKVLAVKKIDLSSVPNQDPEDFVEVVSNISQFHHPNVTELVGYCSEHGQCLLVYEFLKNGSLHDYLHLADDFSKPLTWNTRVKIALGTAKALEYLHEVCSPSVVHKNFKSANILLDAELNPHLSDCGLANLVPSTDRQASHQNSGSGYNAPEVAMSGQYTLKSDVYSFGVVMLELMTGRMPFDSSRPRQEQSLVRWATPQLHDIDALTKMVDPALKELYPVKSLSRFADVIALCVQLEPEFRPPMSEVVQSLVTLVQRANMSKRTIGSDSFSSRPVDS